MIHAQTSKLVALTPPAAIVDNTSYTVAELDTVGYDYCRIIVLLGATDIAMAELTVTESDASAQGHGDVTGLIFGTSDNTGGGTSTLPSASDDDKFFIFEIDLKARKRYLDVTATAGDGSAGTYAVIWAELWNADTMPNSAAEEGASQILRV